MSNTTVRSNNNQNKTEVTGMEIIVFNPRENENEYEYEIKAGVRWLTSKNKLANCRKS